MPMTSRFARRSSWAAVAVLAASLCSAAALAHGAPALDVVVNPVAGVLVPPRHAPLTPPPREGVFPVRAPHDFGTFENRFGGGRGHEGQDVLAHCGARVVAALSGTVTDVRWESAAGNYVVVKASDGTSQVYMHLLAASPLRAGAKVEAGARVGRVGQTGRASTCHLHFELWTAPGWYTGGRAIDPLATLRRWDAAS